MLAKRIIPCLDIHRGRVVKGVNFVDLRDAGDPVEQARLYEAEQADELVFLDISATAEARDTVAELARRVADQVFIPFTIGGGIRTLEDVRAILRAGADKVSLNSAAVRTPDLINIASAHFGSQAIVVAIDAKREARGKERKDNTNEVLRNSAWQVFISSGKVASGLDAVAWAREVAARGAGEILLTSIDADGTQAGYDLELTRTVASAVKIPVIASGGAGKPEDFATVLTEGNASAALAASLFHFRQLSVPQLKAFLRARGIPVRS